MSLGNYHRIIVRSVLLTMVIQPNSQKILAGWHFSEIKIDNQL